MGLAIHPMTFKLMMHCGMHMLHEGPDGAGPMSNVNSKIPNVQCQNFKNVNVKNFKNNTVKISVSISTFKKAPNVNIRILKAIVKFHN